MYIPLSNSAAGPTTYIETAGNEVDLCETLNKEHCINTLEESLNVLVQQQAHLMEQQHASILEQKLHRAQLEIKM